MLTKDFLAAVLPSQTQDFYCGVELKIVKKTIEGEEKEVLYPRTHTFVESIDALEETVNAFSERGYEAYFALATFKANTNRTAENSNRIKCLFADVDVGTGSKKYPTASEALKGINAWITDVGFPEPYIVSSGYGIHCYWPFLADVPVEVWKPVAESFKRACAAKDFFIDHSVSADSARVLRAPNTKNRKKGSSKTTRVLLEGTPLSFEHYVEVLSPWKKEARTVIETKPFLSDFLDTAPSYATTGASYKTELQEISQGNFDKIVELGEDGCLQINHYIHNAADDGIEPLFRSVISIAKFCVDGEDRAYELGKLHPYDDDRIGRKLAGIKGPHNCATFDSSQPGICPGCKHWGKIHNPIALGRELKLTVVEVHSQSTSSSDADSATGPGKTQMDAAPPGYQFSDLGVACEFTTPEGHPRVALLADTPFYAKATYDRAGERFVQFNYVEHGEEKMTVMPMSVATSRDDSIKAFAKLGILVSNGMEAAFRTYLKVTIAIAKKSPPLIMPTNLGWQTDGSFAFNSRIYTKAGDFEVPLYGFENISETIGVKGSIDGWRLVVAGVMRLERWDILSMMAISFGAPLMRYTGLNGLTFHLCGNDSGRGKTLCQRLASSVWGVPDKFRTTPNTSPVAMINRLGMLGSLPLMVDEITHRGRAEAEWFPEFLSQMSDGRGKDRMESQTNTERRNTTTWSTIALMTSNKHMMDYLTAERSHGSEGEVRRLIEITFDRELNMDDLTRSLLFDTLPENYGVAGEAYAKWLVRNQDVAKKIVKDTYAELFDRFEATGDERFWIAGCACILAGVRLAGKAYADVVNIPIAKIAAYLYEVIKYMREETGRMKRSAVDVLNEFTKRNFGKLVTVNDRVARISGIEVAEVMDRQDLCGRVEKFANHAWIDYYIEEKEMRSFCSSLSYGYNEFKRDLSKTYKLKFGQKNLLYGTKGPSMSVRCVHVSLPREVADDIFEKKAANA